MAITPTHFHPGVIAGTIITASTALVTHGGFHLGLDPTGDIPLIGVAIMADIMACMIHSTAHSTVLTTGTDPIIMATIPTTMVITVALTTTIMIM
jgi:hypothetical protein